MNLKDILEKEIDGKIEKLSAILENNHSRKDLECAERLREEINYRKALLETM